MLTLKTGKSSVGKKKHKYRYVFMCTSTRKYINFLVKMYMVSPSTINYLKTSNPTNVGKNAKL